MKGNHSFSLRHFPCVEGKTAVSPDGRLFATKTVERLIVYCFATLKSQIDIRAPYSIKFIKFSLDTKYVGWSSVNPSVLRLCEIETEHVLDIDIQPGLEIISLVFGPQCVVYVSELEVYVGVYECETHKSFTLDGCSLDGFDRPLLQFSPKDDYLCMVRGHQIVIYNTANWSLVTVFDCPVCPLVPVFTGQCTIFITNHDGAVKWYSAFGLELKSEAISPSKCLLSFELSKDRRKLFAATYDNQIICYDTISMKRHVLLEYNIYTVEPQNEIQVFSVTETIEKGSSMDSLKYEISTDTVLKVLKNLLDEFKLKIKCRHLLVLNHDDTLLATVNPSYPDVIWIWDFLKTDKLKIVIRLPAMAGTAKVLRWHQRANLLAAECSNLVVIWKDKGLVALPGEDISFKWLNLKVPVGMITVGSDCRFVCF